MNKHTINSYKFNELSDDAKDVARNWYRGRITVDEWSDLVIEDAAHVGINIRGFDVGRRNDIAGTVDDTEATARAIVKEHGEQCETYKTATAYLTERDAIIAAAAKDEDGEYEDEDELDGQLDEAGKEFSRSILEDYLSILREAYEYVYSDEAIDEAIEANEYDFDEDGERFRYC